MAKVTAWTEKDGSKVTTKISIDNHSIPDLYPLMCACEVQKGSCGTVPPKYVCRESPFRIGTAVSVNGVLTLSNFISAVPSENNDAQPFFKFYVSLLPRGITELVSL